MLKTPKGLYIRTNEGRIYAVHSGNQLRWSYSGPTVPRVQQFSQSVVYAVGSGMGSPLDVWGSSHSAVDNTYNSIHHNTPTQTSMLNDDPYSTRYVSQSFTAGCTRSNSVVSSVTSSVVCSVGPRRFPNGSTSHDGNFTWSSPVTHQNTGNVTSDEVQLSLVQQQQQQYQDTSMFRVNNCTPQSTSCSYLPSDLQCIDASTVTDSVSVSDTTLPTLTLRHQLDADTDTLDSDI